MLARPLTVGDKVSRRSNLSNSSTSSPRRKITSIDLGSDFSSSVAGTKTKLSPMTSRSSSVNSFLRRSNQISIQQLIAEKKAKEQQSQKVEHEKIALVLNDSQKHRVKSLALITNKQQQLHQVEKMNYKRQVQKDPYIADNKQKVQEVYDYKPFQKEKKYHNTIELPHLAIRLVTDRVEGLYNFNQQLKEKERLLAYPAVSYEEKQNLRKIVMDIVEPFLYFLYDNLRIQGNESLIDRRSPIRYHRRGGVVDVEDDLLITSPKVEVGREDVDDYL